jgi:hypothetical protein
MRYTRRAASLSPKKHWYDAPEGNCYKEVFEYVSMVESQQFATYNRFLQLEVLYDPNSPAATGTEGTSETPGLVIENLIASCVDTVTAQVAAVDVRPRFMTDNAGWSVQRTAKKLERYAEGLGKLIGIHKECGKAFKSAAKKGTGAVKVYVDQFDEVKCEHVRIDDLIVDEAECRNGGKPRQIHRRLTNVSRAELKAMFPGDESEEKIDRAQSTGTPRLWAGYRPIGHDELVVIESHKLPIGKKGKAGYRPGRHTICIDNFTLLDEEWDKSFFPYACMTWSERENAFYGISLSEGIAGIQRALNKRNLQIDRGLDLGAFPTTYVSMADANLSIQTINRLGSVAVYKGTPPQTVMPPAVSPEVYQHRDQLKSAAYENSGISRMAASAMKPAGLDSGVAMREYRDQTTQRYAMPEKEYEDLILQCYWLALDCCKDLGEAAPEIPRKVRFGSKKIAWADVDMGDVKVQIAAASTLSRTPAGRMQTALEWAQAGVISTDEWRRLTEHPDLDRVLSLYTQGMDTIERDIEAIEEGNYNVQPEPFGNLALMVRMGQMAYLRDRDYDDPDDPVPEEVLEALRQYAVIAADMLSPEQPANANMAPGAMPVDPSMPAPAPGQPVAALAPQAMDLMAG